MKRLVYIPFILLALLVITLAAATFIEDRLGTPFVREHVYGSWWFVVLWGLTAFFSLLVSIKTKLYKRLPVFLLHIAFIVILVGALLTFLTAQRGQVLLRTDGQTTVQGMTIPFEIKLQHFKIEYYPGTNSPSDFISTVLITDNSKTDSAVISMNNIHTHRGYRLYQTSYDADLQGSLLSLSYDFYGTTVTYIGYALLLVSLVWIPIARVKGYKGERVKG